MSKFFIDVPILVNDTYTILGEDATHISKSLRMGEGDTVILSHKGIDYSCKIMDVINQEVKVSVLSSYINKSEPSIQVTLYQGVPKADKMDLIVQKSVELGVSTIIPVIMNRCVSKPDPKSCEKKIIRWQKVSQEAAKQSGRGNIPRVLPFMSFNEALSRMENKACNIMFYENGGHRLYHVISLNEKRFNIFIGPEGGFEKDEVMKFIDAGGSVATLGKRILRTETAPLAALSAIMYQTGNF